MVRSRRGCGKCGKAEAFFVEAFPSNSWKSSRRSRRRRPLSISTVAPFSTALRADRGFRLAEEEPDIRNGKNPSKIRDPNSNVNWVAQIEAGQITPQQAAREHQLSRSLIEYWREQYRQNALVDRPSKRERQLEAENEKLKAKIGDLYLQMEHIKKLQAWVQRKKNADTSVITAKNWDQFRKPAK